jgi:phosphoribosylaminoimidazolecarboxamide formyltransferase/IMP cyclohydrolase
MLQIKTVLISVSDKTGVVQFAKELSDLGIKIISTEGTASLLRQADIPVTLISDITGFPEIMDGRVKTLHPRIHAALLAVRSKKEHIEQLIKHNIQPIDMVVVNLYPFEEVVNSDEVFLKEAIENIDIGGVALIRSAAKNYENIAVVTDFRDYKDIINELKRNNISKKTLERLALKAFQLTARYDSIISDFLNKRLNKNQFPDILNISFEKVQDLRYGENPHQQAAFYKEPFIKENCIANVKQLHGKELSFNNILDANDAFELVKDFNKPTAAIIKHTNPCGVACSDSIEKAFKIAYESDPLSAFGSVIALNKTCTLEIAESIKKIFVEIIICPNYDNNALELLKQKKNLRILETKGTRKNNKGYDLRWVVNGLLAQSRNFPEIKENDLKVVSNLLPSQEQIRDMLFAFKVNKHVKSNAIVFAKNEATVGIGPGQTSRVDAVRIAAFKSKEKANKAVMASDAFFPFRDGIDEAAKAGIKAVIQPGGSIRDQEVIDAVNEHKMVMVFTGQRLFRH